MLILTRRISENIIINDDIFITILGSKGNQVRLGFDAPQGVSIHRQEIYQKIKAEQQLTLKDTVNWRAGQDLLSHYIN